MSHRQLRLGTDPGQRLGTWIVYGPLLQRNPYENDSNSWHHIDGPRYGFARLLCISHATHASLTHGPASDQSVAPRSRGLRPHLRYRSFIWRPAADEQEKERAVNASPILTFSNCFSCDLTIKGAPDYGAVGVVVTLAAKLPIPTASLGLPYGSFMSPPHRIQLVGASGP